MPPTFHIKHTAAYKDADYLTIKPRSLCRQIRIYFFGHDNIKDTKFNTCDKQILVETNENFKSQ